MSDEDLNDTDISIIKLMGNSYDQAINKGVDKGFNSAFDAMIAAVEGVREKSEEFLFELDDVLDLIRSARETITKKEAEEEYNGPRLVK